MTAKAKPNLVLKPMALYRAPAMTRHNAIKAGVSAEVVGAYATKMGVRKTFLSEMLNLRRIPLDKNLRQDEAERILGLVTLIGNVMDLVKNGGSSAEFDAYKWVADWLQRPVPAIGDTAPMEFMDTMTGQAIVSNLFEMARSTAYA